MIDLRSLTAWLHVMAASLAAETNKPASEPVPVPETEPTWPSEEALARWRKTFPAGCLV